MLKRLPVVGVLLEMGLSSYRIAQVVGGIHTTIEQDAKRLGIDYPVNIKDVDKLRVVTETYLKLHDRVLSSRLTEDEKKVFRVCRRELKIESLTAFASGLVEGVHVAMFSAVKRKYGPYYRLWCKIQGLSRLDLDSPVQLVIEYLKNIPNEDVTHPDQLQYGLLNFFRKKYRDLNTAVDKIFTLRAIKDAIEHLPRLEERVIELHYGLGSEKPLSMNEIKKKLLAGSASAVQVAHEKAVEMIRIIVRNSHVVHRKMGGHEVALLRQVKIRNLDIPPTTARLLILNGVTTLYDLARISPTSVRMLPRIGRGYDQFITTLKRCDASRGLPAEWQTIIYPETKTSRRGRR